MKPAINITSAIILILMVSCHQGPYEQDFTTDKPTGSDVAGLYELKEKHVGEFPTQGSAENTILFKSDGTYQANKIPNVFGGEFAEKDSVIFAKGRWKIDSIGTVDNSWGQPTTHWGVTLTNIDKNFRTWGFMGSSPPYQLILAFDDPSLGQAIIFSKN